MSSPHMLFARIDSDLVNRVLIPAVEARLRELRQSELTTSAEQIETAYMLARLRSAMNQKLPGAYIRQPGPTQLANAARMARQEVCHGR